MIVYNPTIVVKKLYAFKGGREVLAMTFHNGLNVIYGSNGSGKTSVIQLLVYVLGATVTNWKEEAGSCDYVIAEIFVNESTITISREISDSMAGMSIFFGTYDESIKVGKSGWFSYPYAISENKESFSQRIFEILNIPEAKSDGVSNLTLHQILRLVYSNQSDPATNIFNNENFDSAIKREFISNYLLGLYDNELYNNKLELIKKDKELTKVIAELKGLLLLIDGQDIELRSESTKAISEELQKKIDSIIEEVEKYKEQDIKLKFSDEVKAISAGSLIKNKNKLVTLEVELSRVKYNIADSIQFIDELNNKLLSINDSIKFSDIFKFKEFDTCPSCFSKLSVTHDDNKCSLCGTDDLDSAKKINYARMKNEIIIQIKESQDILEKNKNKSDDILKKIKILKSGMRKDINKISVVSVSLNSHNDSILYNKYKEIGELEERIDGLARMNVIYSKIKALQSLRNDLQDRVCFLKDSISKKEYILQLKTPELKEKISQYMKEILSNDIENIKDESDKAEFSKITSIDFDFSSNRIIVNNKVSFSESSMYYLNNALHIALLKLSLVDPNVRFPRLLILDGIENGGMEDARSKGIQKTLKDISDEFSMVRHQVIITTKGIYSEVDNENYRVGLKFTSANRSLNM
ncbi:AAA family ATPase [Morganella morganii]|uniref:AAA family ATPase n=1 Tax=Morganella morganii TaxID=582 RepID=UPI0016449769|nr:AAA family ATPase [Morganella morganii]ELB1288276.1 AAA family ATPase [Morganella morganii]MBC3974274.1 AAA family ATPase [Morganella morganii]